MLNHACVLRDVGAWQVILPGLEMTWSGDLCALHGVPPDYQPSINAAIAFYVPEHRGVIRHLLNRCVVAGENFEVELQLVTALGKKLLVRITGYSLRNAAGAITHVQGAMQEISVLQLTEVTHRMTADRLSTMLETISDAVFILDTNSRFM